MDYGKILKLTDKYLYLSCTNDKCKILSSSDKKSEAKKEMTKKLNENSEGKTIYFVTLTQYPKGAWKPEEHILIPSPLHMEISEYEVVKGKKLKKFSSGINNMVFFTDKYLMKNKKIKKDDIKNLVLKYNNKELKKGLMSKNTI